MLCKCSREKQNVMTSTVLLTGSTVLSPLWGHLGPGIPSLTIVVTTLERALREKLGVPATGFGVCLEASAPISSHLLRTWDGFMWGSWEKFSRVSGNGPPQTPFPSYVTC